MIVDLHCHSYYSDGSLSPVDLIRQAEANNVQMLSITDHDNIDAYEKCLEINTDIDLISGIEFSTTWNKISVHIVGLNFNVKSFEIQTAVAFQKQARKDRAMLISDKLKRFGLLNAYEKICSKKTFGQIGRPDFAELMVEEGLFSTTTQVFKKALGAGKVGDVKSQWLKLDEVINAINKAGGVAVLAHPLCYQLTNAKLKRLIHDFKALGGEAIEVVNGYQIPDKTDYLLSLCKNNSLMASVGSDFHHPNSWSRLGCQIDWLKDVNCVWQHF